MSTERAEARNYHRDFTRLVDTHTVQEGHTVVERDVTPYQKRLVDTLASHYVNEAPDSTFVKTFPTVVNLFHAKQDIQEAKKNEDNEMLTHTRNRVTFLQETILGAFEDPKKGIVELGEISPIEVFFINTNQLVRSFKEDGDEQPYKSVAEVLEKIASNNPKENPEH